MDSGKPQPSYDLLAWRERIPLLRRLTPMNNCSQSPQLDVTRAAAETYLESWNQAGMDWDAWIDEVKLAKLEFARLIGARYEDIAISSSLTEATASVASGLDYTGKRRKVVLTDAEFPTVGHIWLAHGRYGAEVCWVPTRDDIIYPEDYDPFLDEETLIVSTFHAYYQNGFRQDLKLLADKVHAVGALLCIDAYQTLGVSPVNVKEDGVDILASGNLKYLLGVPGVAFTYVNPQVVDRLHPALTGWFGREDPFAFLTKKLDWHPTATRLETGTPPVVNAYISRAGMQVINEVGIHNIKAWTDELQKYLIAEGLRRGLKIHGTTDFRQKTPSTAFVIPDGDSHTVEDMMLERGVISSSRGPVIRLAPHFYSTFADVDKALDALEEVLELRSRGIGERRPHKEPDLSYA